MVNEANNGVLVVKYYIKGVNWWAGLELTELSLLESGLEILVSK